LDYQSKQHGKKWAKRLAAEQRKMARRRTPKGTPKTNGYLEAQRATAILHAKVARCRHDDARKWAKQVVENGDVAVEAFRPKFLAKSTMARKAADIALGALQRELVERGRRYGRQVVMVDPKYSTMDCSKCDVRAKRRLELDERTFSCWSCGHTADRDVNSAHVVLKRAGFVPSGVDRGRPRCLVGIGAA
jgi:putative transposase